MCKSFHGVCEICETPFVYIPLKKGYERRTCSRSCANKLARRTSAAHGKQSSKQNYKLKCEYCHSKFTWHGFTWAPKPKTCSKSCAHRLGVKVRWQDEEATDREIETRIEVVKTLAFESIATGELPSVDELKQSKHRTILTKCKEKSCGKQFMGYEIRGTITKYCSDDCRKADMSRIAKRFKPVEVDLTPKEIYEQAERIRAERSSRNVEPKTVKRPRNYYNYIHASARKYAGTK